MRKTINSTDTLIIRSRMASGSVYTVELEQKVWTDAEIQQFIDTVVDERETVISVWRVECDELHGLPMTVEDLTEGFDVRSLEEREEFARSAERSASAYRTRLERQYGTYHTIGGRVA